MATDYDAPRKTEEDVSEDSLEELKTRQSGGKQSSAVDVDETDLADGFELPGADLSGEELLIQSCHPPSLTNLRVSTVSW